MKKSSCLGAVEVLYLQKHSDMLAAQVGQSSRLQLPPPIHSSLFSHTHKKRKLKIKVNINECITDLKQYNSRFVSVMVSC